MAYFEELEATSDVKYIDNHGHGDDYSVVKMLIQRYAERKVRKWAQYHLIKKGRPVEVFQYFNHATYETKQTKAFDGPQEEYEVLESLFDRLNKVPMH